MIYFELSSGVAKEVDTNLYGSTTCLCINEVRLAR